MVFGYVKVSSDQQDMRSHRHAVLEYVSRNKIHIDDFIAAESLDVKARKGGGTKQPTTKLRKGDTFIVPQLSHLARSIAGVIYVLDHLVNRGIRLIAVKENLDFKPSSDDSRLMLRMFSLAVELQRELISDRTRRALAAKRKQGVVLGRPKGRPGRSKLDSHAEEIVDLLKDKASYSFMARRFKVSLPTIIAFVKTRKLRELLREIAEQ